jgi:hypothetical protein
MAGTGVMGAGGRWDWTTCGTLAIRPPPELRPVDDEVARR